LYSSINYLVKYYIFNSQDANVWEQKLIEKKKNDSKINERIKLGRYAISILNSILFDKVVRKRKRNIFIRQLCKVLPNMGVRYGELENNITKFRGLCASCLDQQELLGE
jgi:hypothetical protein